MFILSMYESPFHFLKSIINKWRKFTYTENVLDLVRKYLHCEDIYFSL